MRRASAAELVGCGEVLLSHADLTLHSPEQYAAAGFPFRLPDDDAAIDWSPARRLTDSAPVWLPTSVAVLSHGIGRSNRAAHFPVCSGVAAGRDPETTAAASLSEAIERDALPTAWYLRRNFLLLRSCARVGAPDALPAGDPYATSLALEAVVSLHLIPSATGLPVVLAVVRSPSPVAGRGALIGVGAAARTSASDAAAKATAEAYQSLGTAVALDDPEDPERAALVRPRGPLVPWRADRCYLDDYRADLRDVVDLMCHAQLLLDERVVAAVQCRLRAEPSDSAYTLSDVPDGPADLIAATTAVHGAPVCVDLTPDDLRGQGWWVLRATVPGLRSLAPAAFPFLAALDLPSSFSGMDALVPFA